MPKVGCFWPGLFKSSNCLFPWAARETGKCSFFCSAIHISVWENQSWRGLQHPPSPRHLVGCAAWLCKCQGWSLFGGFPQAALPGDLLDLSVLQHLPPPPPARAP